jgi:hypothetical protein
MAKSKVSTCRDDSRIACAALLTLASILLFGCNRTQTAVDRSSEPGEVPYGTKIVFGQSGNSDA